MVREVATTVPYDRQTDTQTRRDCGAACLSMVYRSLGKEVTTAEIWPKIAKKNNFGSIASTTHLMVKDAMSRDLAAVAFVTRHPLQTLRHCCESGTRAILNHRQTADSPAGHYTVLVDVDARDVVLHDPMSGPSRRVPHDELLELWQPRLPASEIPGYLLIAIADEPPAATACWLCHAPLPAAVACPRCKEPVGLQPAGALGCLDNSCVARMWHYLCCPACDYLWNSASATPPATGAGDARAQAGAGASTQEEALNFSPLFAELDKFCNLILGMPAAANHPDIKRNLDALAARKEELKKAQAVASRICKRIRSNWRVWFGKPRRSRRRTARKWKNSTGLPRRWMPTRWAAPS